MFSSQNSQVSNDAVFVEDVFSTFLYTGNDSSRTIENGIDLAGDGGLVWIKIRDQAGNHILTDTARGVNAYLRSNTTDASVTPSSNYGVTSFANNGFGLDQSIGSLLTNTTGKNYVSWTFRKQPKFFDVVTYTGNITARTIAHNLGSVPGMIVVKQTSGAGGTWWVYHRSLGETQYLSLDETTAAGSAGNLWNSSAPTSTVFSIGANGNVNANGETYVAYLFAHNAGGFGLTGTDNVISCGSFTCDGSGNATVDLGYEPQWILRKASNEITNWELFDNMRGLSVTDNATKLLYPNLSNAEENTSKAKPTATGFIAKGEISKTYIYIAIRRGPMKVPTSGTSVFSPNQTSGTTGTQITTGFPVDWQLLGMNDGNVYNQRSSTRLTGVNTDGTSNSQYLVTSNTNAEAATGSVTLNWGSTGFQVPSLNSGSPTIFWNFRRAPSFFDEVCYTGTGVANRNITHNLTVVPELVIVKNRTSADYWYVRHANATGDLYLNSTSAQDADFYFLGTPTSTTFNVAYGDNSVNGSGKNYVAYLFSSCAGVSKVGGYTGTGTTQQINCGFASGARFVLIKCASSSGDWYVWDSARGIVSGNDPYLLLNSTAAEVTSTDYIDTYSAGFEISSTAPADINASGRTFVFLAIA